MTFLEMSALGVVGIFLLAAVFTVGVLIGYVAAALWDWLSNDSNDEDEHATYF